MSEATIYARHGSAAWRKLEGEMVLVHAEREMILGLNGVGARIWELLDGQRPAREVARAIAEEYRRTPADVLADVLPFLADLERRHLVVSVG
jgi:hypothetical protein